MAPKPSRNLVEVKVRTADEAADGRGVLAFWAPQPVAKWIPAEFVRYAERSEAWNLAFPSGNVAMPGKWDEAQRILMAMHHVGDETPIRAGIPPKVPEVKVPEAVPAVGSFDALIDARIDAAVSAGKAGVDKSEVLAIVEEFAETLAPKVTQVVYRDREPVEIKGTPHAVLPKVLALVNKGKLPWLVGPAGTGKSTLARQVAECLSIPFRSIGCSPMMSTAAIFGYMDAQGRYVPTDFRRCYAEGGVFLLDEIDAAHAGVLTALNDALANGSASFPDEQVKRHEDFVCIVAANTYGRGADRQYVGRNALDAATTNRFKMIEVDYDAALEEALALAHNAGKGHAWLNIVRKIRANATQYGVKVVVSTRSVMDCDLLDDFKVEEILDMSIFQGIEDGQKRKLLEGVSLSV